MRNGTAAASPCSARLATAARRTPLGCVESVKFWMCSAKDDIFLFPIQVSDEVLAFKRNKTNYPLEKIQFS